jgi:SAM-dependent methyltransferase
MNTPDAEMWNQRFAARPDCYGTAPNAWLAKNARRIRAHGDVLCLAEGQGRNALWLAQRGHRVTAVDISAVALDQVRERARGFGVELATIEADLAVWPAPEARYDAVVLVFAHFPPAIRRRVHQLAEIALRSRGFVILEAFSKYQLGLTSGGPKDPALLQSVEELAADFAAVEIITLEEATIVLDEGPLHQGEAHVVRLLAER